MDRRAFVKSLIAGGAGLFIMNNTPRASDEEQSSSSIEKVDYSAYKFVDGNIIMPDVPGFGLSPE